MFTLQFLQFGKIRFGLLKSLDVIKRFVWISGTSGVLLRKVNGTAIVRLPSKQQVQVSQIQNMKTIHRNVFVPRNVLIKMLPVVVGRCWRPAW